MTCRLVLPTLMTRLRRPAPTTEKAMTTNAHPPQKRTPGEIAAVQERYASRIKARLGAPNIDPMSARDGILDCFVATYFGGLKEGIGGYLGIDASEDHVARIAQALFRKKLVAHGATFDAPTVSALDKVREEVDQELHFHDLPAELRGVHDQVCSLLLSKAEGTLPHRGATSVARTSSAPQAPATVTRPTPTRPTSAATGSTPRPSVSIDLRNALATFLEEMAAGVREGEAPSQLTARLAKANRLLETLQDFE